MSTPTATDWIPRVDLDLNALAELVTVVPLPDGAWILWRSAEPSLSPNPLMGLRVDAKGSPISQPVVLLTPSNGVAYFASAALGPRLVIGWLDDVAPGGGYNTIRLRAFDPSGVELWTTGYTPKKGFEGGGVTLLGDPSGNHLLMAWTIDFGSWSEDTPRVVRFDCP